MSGEAIKKFLGNATTVAVVCNQWGDTGKGKFVDLLSGWADVIARGTGGANAGHTIRIGDRQHIFHLIPSGILRDTEGKINVIGSGTAFDPRAACEELAVLEKAGLSYGNLRIAHNARLVLPQHVVLDRVRESNAGGRVGTTGRGIGPVYADHYARVGLFVNDMLNPEVFARKLKQNLREKLTILRNYDPEVVRRVLEHPHAGGGRFWNKEAIFDTAAIMEAYREYGARLRVMVADTDSMVRTMREQGKHILLEGAQGNLLSVDIGTYPYVTSSDASVRALAQGVGLRERDVDLALGIVKAFYMTRVGEGPFPTEIGGAESAAWCNTSGITKATEEEQFPDADVNDAVPFRQGVGIRRAGAEYGATTGRPRRVGWLDLPLLRYSKHYTGQEVVLTKLDVLDACKEIKICTAYEYGGPDYQFGAETLRAGKKLEVAVPDTEVMAHCAPVYAAFPGWCIPIRSMRSHRELPKQLLDIIRFVEREADVHVRAVSVGPDREETIFAG
ncbi:MAG: adenylosuccinate synthase [Candidatus Liptonbacteria bacterium]|nr:adenylosuccinate synthase [Candidatus Liptonbacteria bacterium]